MEFTINEQTYHVDAEGNEPLLTVLREYIGLTGSKYGCGEGACGACTVLMDGVAVRSCSVPVSAVGRKRITTIEGLAHNGKLHVVQEAFLKEDVFQCAYCAPGMILSAVSLLSRNPDPTKQDMVRAMQGNVCRCGTYPRILDAISKAVEFQKRR